MNKFSVNGILKPNPTDSIVIEKQYNGHFLKVSYIQQISGNPVYSKDRVNVEDDGNFRFLIPKDDLIDNERILIEVYAPDGGFIGSNNYSYSSLKAEHSSELGIDKSAKLIIKINPKVIEFNDTAPSKTLNKKISGKIIDISGERKAAGLQLIIMANDGDSAELGSESFIPVFSSVSNDDGYFYGSIDNNAYTQAYALITGLSEQPIVINLDDDNTFPKNIILVADLTELPAYRQNNSSVPNRPDAEDLVNSSSFSQDLGGTCIDFTVPNRTLEEHSFYQTVRTTEPEIKGLTITPKKSQEMKMEFLDISESLFQVFSSLNNSFSTVSVASYSATQMQPDVIPVQQEMVQQIVGSNQASKEVIAELEREKRVGVGSALRTNAHTVQSAPSIQAPLYSLNLTSSYNPDLKFKATELLTYEKNFTFIGLIKILADQDKRKNKLNALHLKLAAAYCGKYGIQEAQSFCDTLTLKDDLSRGTIQSLLGHIKKYKNFAKSAVNEDLFKTNITELTEAMKQEYISADVLDILESKMLKLIDLIDKNTPESQDQEELLGYIRRVVIELSQAKDSQLSSFEPCPPAPKADTVGIVCLMRQFEDTKNTLQNKSIFTLSEISTIRSNYDTFISSITSFLSLLDEFYSFYRSSSRLMTSIDDDYFVENYSEIKSTLVTTKKQIYRAIILIEKIEREYINNHPGRRDLTVENSVDWDETPTIYENTTIAHGHILHFKQKWKADGYSLGDLLYSLPLGPCQEKQIAILDWDREETARRSESQTSVDSLSAQISRDRDISEIMNSSLNQNSRANSRNSTSSTSAAIGGGIGGFIGQAVFGIAGGISSSGAVSASSASQSSSRNLSANAMNSLQDNTSQSALSLRSQRNTVIQTVGQNESVMAQTEVIKNNNHCHAMTVEYFEVLRHYAIEQELVGVQECLYLPLPMSLFDHAKVLRWRDTLRRSVYGRKLRKGFYAIERIENNYANSDFPLSTYSEENIEEFKGYFTITFDLTRPAIREIDDATKTERYNLKIDFPWFIGHMVIPYSVDRPLTEAEKDAIFEEKYAPNIARKFIETMEVAGLDDAGDEVTLDLDFTILSNYRKGRAMRVNVASNSLQTINREQIKHLRFRAKTSVKATSKIILKSVYLSYRTQHLNEYIIRNSRVNNDIINTRQLHINFGSDPIVELHEVTDSALMYTPLNRNELKNPRKEDREAAELLISFLNEHLEMSHKIIWAAMDSSRLFGLLDGYIAPNSGGKSVASLVENKIMGIVGNNLVLNVVPGVRLDPVFKDVDNLFDYYRPETSPDPFRISVPTKGVYAESVMGKCNSCEEIDDTRHWRFNDEPCGTKPTDISALSTDSRRSDPGGLQTKDLSPSIINLQNAPTAPDPTGLGEAISAITKSDAFKDITGLDGTQNNAIKALETTSKSVTEIASLAADIQKSQAMKKDIGKTLDTIDKAKKDNQISEEDANKLSLSALESMVGEPTKKDEKLTDQEEIKELIKSESEKDNTNIKIIQGSDSIEISTPEEGEEDA